MRCDLWRGRVGGLKKGPVGVSDARPRTTDTNGKGSDAVKAKRFWKGFGWAVVATIAMGRDAARRGEPNSEVNG